jgi:hypothetical protein
MLACKAATGLKGVVLNFDNRPFREDEDNVLVSVCLISVIVPTPSGYEVRMNRRATKG